MAKLALTKALSSPPPIAPMEITFDSLYIFSLGLETSENGLFKWVLEVNFILFPSKNIPYVRQSTLVYLDSSAEVIMSD